jgi:hypothetical protein
MRKADVGSRAKEWRQRCNDRQGVTWTEWRSVPRLKSRVVEIVTDSVLIVCDSYARLITDWTISGYVEQRSWQLKKG